MNRHRRRGLQDRMGREFKKPTDLRRKHPDNLDTLTYNQLRKRAKIVEHHKTKVGKDEFGQPIYRQRYNVVMRDSGMPRTVTLEG